LFRVEAKDNLRVDVYVTFQLGFVIVAFVVLFCFVLFDTGRPGYL
jgi:hypothetical protein